MDDLDEAAQDATLEDAEAFYIAARASIAEVFPFLPWCHPDYDIEDTRNWLLTVQDDWQAGASYAFLIEHHGQLVGGCGINALDEHGGANLGYWIRSDVTARGYASEATRALAAWAFEHLSMHRIEIVMSVHNLASQKVAEKAGALYEATVRNRLLLHDKLHSAHIYSLVPEDVLHLARN